MKKRSSNGSQKNLITNIHHHLPLGFNLGFVFICRQINRILAVLSFPTGRKVLIQADSDFLHPSKTVIRMDLKFPHPSKVLLLTK